MFLRRNWYVSKDQPAQCRKIWTRIPGEIQAPISVAAALREGRPRNRNKTGRNRVAGLSSIGIRWAEVRKINQRHCRVYASPCALQSLKHLLFFAGCDNGFPPRKSQPTATTKGKQPAKLRRSKLAQENDITAEDEAEIKEAWAMFRVHGIKGYEDEKEGVIRTGDVRRAMKAQGMAPDSAKELAQYIDVLDPESEGYVTYPHFVEVCAQKLSQRTDESKLEEVEAAYRLFTRGGDGPINIHHLRRVAKELKQDISDEILRNMILEANGGAGVTRGVGMDDFHAVMTRAGVFQ